MPVSTQDTLQLIESYLGEIGMSKEAAAPTAPEATQPGAESNTKTESIKKLESEGTKMKATQTNLGKEQAAEAKAVGSNVDEVPANSDSEKDAPHAKQAPKTLDIDETVKENSDVLGSVKKQEINMEQKLARAERLANSILEVIEKVAAAPAAEQPVEKQAAEAPMTDEEKLFQKMAEQAAVGAQEYFESHLLGQLTRLRDEQELANAKLDPQVLQKVGGVSGLLDKVAAEDPTAILPEGFELPPEAAAAVGGGAEAAPVDAGAEAGMEAGAGDSGELDQIAAALDEAGVTPEDLQKALMDIQALQEAGVSPEELAQAIEQLSAEDAGGGAEEAPVEAAPEEAPAEEKTASQETPNRVELIKDFLRK